MDEHTFEINRERAIDFLNTRENVYGECFSSYQLSNQG